MRYQPALTLMAATIAAFALSACESGGGEEDSPANENGDAGDAEAVGEMLVVSETGWLTIGKDGAIQTTFFDPDGRYRDMRNGELIGQGGWEQRADGNLCFAPDNGESACWQTGTPDANGTVMATSEDNAKVELKRVTYAAPMQNEAASETLEGEGDATPKLEAGAASNSNP